MRFCEFLVSFLHNRENIGVHDLKHHIDVLKVQSRLRKDNRFNLYNVGVLQQSKELQFSQHPSRINLMFKGIGHLLNGNHILLPLIFRHPIIISNRDGSIGPSSNYINEKVLKLTGL